MPHFSRRHHGHHSHHHHRYPVQPVLVVSRPPVPQIMELPHPSIMRPPTHHPPPPQIIHPHQPLQQPIKEHQIPTPSAPSAPVYSYYG